MQHFKLVLALVWTMGLGTALGRPARDHGRCASTTFAPGSPGFDLDLCGLAKWESFLPYAEYPMKAGYSYFFSAGVFLPGHVNLQSRTRWVGARAVAQSLRSGQPGSDNQIECTSANLLVPSYALANLDVDE